MQAKRKLLPGQPGTQKLVEQYGKALICVRYRYDAEQKRRLKTVELIVDEVHWQKNTQRIPPNKIVDLKVDREEKRLQKLIKAAGGKWNLEKQLWRLTYSEVKQLGLTDRIVHPSEVLSNNRK